jgi:aldehyde dehydrogenase (NAD+)
MKQFGLHEALAALDIQKKNLGTSTGQNWYRSSGDLIESFSPVDGKKIGSLSASDEKGYDRVIVTAASAFKEWRKWPAPKRGRPGVTRKEGSSWQARLIRDG